MQHTWSVIMLCLAAMTVAGCGSTVGTTGGDSASHADALRAAEEAWRGTPYAPGGEDFSGVDPVTFVRRLYEELFDINLPRTASRISSTGREVARSDLAPGDLLLFRLTSGPTHVGIYLGANEFVHVSVEQGVTTSRIDNADWRDAFFTARRLDLPGVETGQQEKPAAPTGNRRRTGW